MDSTIAEERLAAALKEVARLEKELQRARQRAQNGKEELDAFVYAASHDLKQPLRAINSYSQLLTRHCGRDETASEYAAFIVDGVRTAAALIEQLLNFSRAGSSTKRSVVNLAACVATATYKLNREITETRAQVTCGPLPEVSVNQTDFERVFENLIDNAIKYRGPEPPTIRISAEEDEDGHVISVANNTPSVDPKFYTEIFKPFKRLHGNEIPGSGLGLAVCRKIVEAHEGTMWVESGGESGLVFKFSLPY
ncbi:MAG: GHKL domain-containing protein [Acidobacteriaceae bacterium]|nr:GHKL domain-containing protein [Acidobacteriaceae bacterium]